MFLCLTTVFCKSSPIWHLKLTKTCNNTLLKSFEPVSRVCLQQFQFLLSRRKRECNLKNKGKGA